MNKLKKIFLFLNLIFFIFFNNFLLLSADVIYPDIQGEAVLLMDADSGVIYISDDNVDKQLGIASLTKLMSVYVVFDEMKANNIKMDQTVQMSSKAAGLKAQNPVISGVNYEVGQELTFEELLDLSLVLSDNGAIIALSEAVSKTESAHVEKMNKKAKDLGMNNTHFVNVTGLTMVDYGDFILDGTTEDDYNVSSARDLGLLCYNLLKDYPEILDITSKTGLIYEGIEYSTYIELLPNQILEYPGVKGLKTGTSNEAGNCFIGYLETDQRNYISVVLNVSSDSYTNKFLETATMFDWAQEQRYVNLFSGDNPQMFLNIDGASGGDIPLYSNNIDVLAVDNLYLNLLNIEYNPDYFDESGYLQKDIPKGEIICTVSYKTPADNVGLKTIFDETNNLEVDLFAKENVYKQNAFVKVFSAIQIFLMDVFESM